MLNSYCKTNEILLHTIKNPESNTSISAISTLIIKKITVGQNVPNMEITRILKFRVYSIK